MEQHPVPQNVTGFQFKLVGDITLKQFAYIAGGLLSGYVTTKLVLLPVLLRWPIGGFLAVLGFGLAFVPIEERPLDRWLMAFFKSIYSPTQYVWKKDNPVPDVLLSPITIPVEETNKTISLSKQIKLPPPPPPPIKPKVSDLPPASFQRAIPVSTITKTPVTGKRLEIKPKIELPPVIKPLPTDQKQAEELKSEFQKKSYALNEQIALLQQELATGTIAKERLLELQRLLNQLLTEKDQLTRELIKLRQRVAQKPLPITEKPSTYVKLPPTDKTTVKIVPPSIASRVGIPRLTNMPNVINGLVKNSQGVLLPNIIVTVKDQESVPMRALKTNKLGQFAASTPLNDGSYMITVEDPKGKYQFNQIEISLTGQLLPPLEISAISEKDLIRQQLTQEIFGPDRI